MRGTFVSFEGMDGCGKTTQIRRLARRIRALGRNVLETAEPGGTAVGDRIREILLDPTHAALHPAAELLLYFASRAQNVAECIRPALEAGSVVLSDRFTDSSMAYQGYGRGLGAENVRMLEALACGGLRPDITVLIDVDLETSLQRARKRNTQSGDGQTRMDEQSIDFYRRVRAAYCRMAEEEPRRFRVIDGRAGIDEIERRVWDAVAAYV